MVAVSFPVGGVVAVLRVYSYASSAHAIPTADADGQLRAGIGYRSLTGRRFVLDCPL